MRKVDRVVDGQVTPEGDGMVVRRAFPSQHLGRLDPFLMLDEMGPIRFEPGARAGFPDHPHRGFETVTMLLEGEFEHRDSHGNAGFLRPGDVQWMTAGGGVVHSEMPSQALREKGGMLHGLQLWVNLPKRDKMMAPRYQEIPAARIPEAIVPGGKVRVVAGEFMGEKAAIDTRTPIQYLHVQLADGGLELPVPPGHEGFLYVWAGQCIAGGRPVKAGQLAILTSEGGDGLRVDSTERMEGILVTGVPLNEPVFQYGPFVMTTRDEIVQAVEDFRAGRFGQIRPRVEQS